MIDDWLMIDWLMIDDDDWIDGDVPRMVIDGDVPRMALRAGPGNLGTSQGQQGPK